MTQIGRKKRVNFFQSFTKAQTALGIAFC